MVLGFSFGKGIGYCFSPLNSYSSVDIFSMCTVDIWQYVYFLDICLFHQRSLMFWCTIIHSISYSCSYFLKVCINVFFIFIPNFSNFNLFSFFLTNLPESLSILYFFKELTLGFVYFLCCFLFSVSLISTLICRTVFLLHSFNSLLGHLQLCLSLLFLYVCYLKMS